MVKKPLTVLITIFFILTACNRDAPGPGAPAADNGGIVVGFSQIGSESDWRLANTKSMRETFSEANGYKLIFRDAQQKQENQIAAIREFIALNVDYIVLAPVTEEGWDGVLGEARASGVPVVVMDRMIGTADDQLYACWVGSNFRRESETAVEWMRDNFRDKTELTIVHIQGSLGSSAQIGRTEGLMNGVADNPGWEVIYAASGDFTQVKGKEVMEYVLKQFSHFDVLFCENDNMAFGAIEAMDAAKREYGVGGGAAVISFDATRAGLMATISGGINFNVECNPLLGPRVEAIIRQLADGETPAKLAFVEEAAFDAATVTRGDVDAREY